ncbi:MAG: hypothetical protein ACI4TS_03645, partial [Bacteroidaceae bacterium]
MKKFLLLLALVMMGAMWSSVDARWVIGDRKTAADIKPGDTIVIEQSSRASYLGYYIQAVNGSRGVEMLSGTGVDDAAVIVVEEGPADLRTGGPTVYLRMVASDKYIGNGTTWAGGCGVASDPAKAANFLVLSCAEDIPWSTTVAWSTPDSRRPGMEGMDEIANWRENTNAGGRGSDENSVGFAYSTSDTKSLYLAFWYNTEPNVIIWQYTDTNQWNVYSASYEKSLQEDLTNLIDLYTSNTEVEFIAGTAPGYYGAAEVEAYENALQNALAVAINPSLTDEEYQAAIDNLKQARLDVEASLVPITDGYYYMVNGFADFLDNFGVEKAAYIDPAVPNLKYRTFDPDNIDFVFNVTSNGTEYEYLVQSYANGYYVAKGTQWYNSNPAATIDPEEPQDIRLRYTGLWYWGSKTYHSTSYTPYASNAPTASDSEGNLTTWGVWKDEATTTYHSNLWYLRPISDEKMAEFAVQKEQADLDAALQNKVKEANDLYSKLFTIVPNFEAPLIKRASGGYNEEPAEDSQIRFSNIRGQGIETADRYEYLIDGDTVTYMQGTGYIALKLDEPHQYVSIVYSPRGGTANQHAWGLQERPKMVNIYGANTLEGDTVYGEPVIKGADMSEMVPHTIDLGRPVNRIAYQVTLNNNGGSYFTLSEFQLYDANVDQNLSQYYTVEGLKDKADALKALAVAKLAIAGEGKSTEADIEELQAAMSAVKSLYSDTTELVNLIAEAEEYIEKLPIGTDMGCVADQTSKDELQKAVDAARELGLKDNVTRDELTTAIANLTAAMKAFFANVKNIEEGKWYFVINADNTEGSLI